MVEMQFISTNFLKRDGDQHISVNHNTPLQLVIIIGAVVLTITLLSSLIWICCASSRGKYRRDRFSKFFKIGNGGGQKMQSRSWNPQKPGSVYDFGEADSIDGLSLREKSDVSNDRQSRATNRSSNNKAPILSPLSPMPVLKDDRATNPFDDPSLRIDSDATVSAPPPVAHPPVQRGRGWQLFDGQVNDQSQDIEAGTLPPARRPSFIDRLLAHRSLSQTNAVKMQTSNTIASPSPVQDAFRGNNRAAFAPLDRCVTTPALFSNTALGGHRAIPSTPAIPGSGLISAIGGAFRRVSQTHQQVTGRRKYVPSPRQLPIESDYEGTIGGRDADLPMARRANQRRPLCGDSHYTPSFTFDPFAVSNALNGQRSPAVAAVMAGKLNSGLSPCPRPTKAIASPTPLPFAPSPLGQSQAKMQGQIGGVPYHTPGMAGVGTNWQRRMSEASIIQISKDQKGRLDDVKRQQDWQHSQDASSSSSRLPKKDKLQSWILSNQFAAVPPPEDVSRRGSAISFAISDRSMPSVSRQNSVSYSHKKRQQNLSQPGPSSSSSKSTKELQRIASLRPHFAPMTTLASWLENEGQNEQVEEMKTERKAKRPDMKRMMSKTTEAEKQSIIEKYLDQAEEGNPFDDRSQVTDYNQSRGMIWEDIPSASGPPSYRTNPSRSSGKKGIAHDPNVSRRETVTVTSEGGERAEFTLVNQSVNNEDEEAERKRLKSEKKMRKRMREARRAAKRAAKEAEAAGLNPELMKLPAVRAAMNELTDAIVTSDSSKAREQTLRHQMIDERSDFFSGAQSPRSLEIEDDLKTHEKSDGTFGNVAPVKWVSELLDQSPEITQAFQVSVLMEKLKAEQRAQEQLPEYKASSPRVKARSKGKPKKSNSYIRKSRRTRLPITRFESPPESPLTSASEYPSSIDRQRRSSMPINRSFLVESRRGSQETELSLSQSSIDRRIAQIKPSKRIVSMPMMMENGIFVQQQVENPVLRQSTQRRLPLPPPVKYQGAARPISAYEQVPTSVWIQ